MLRLLEIDEVEVDLVALEDRDRATAPRAALLAEDLRLDSRDRRSRSCAPLLRVRRRRGSNSLALPLPPAAPSRRLRRATRTLAEQLRDALARLDVTRVGRHLLLEEVANLAADLVRAVEGREHPLGRLLRPLLLRAMGRPHPAAVVTAQATSDKARVAIHPTAPADIAITTALRATRLKRAIGDGLLSTAIPA